MLLQRQKIFLYSSYTLEHLTKKLVLINIVIFTTFLHSEYLYGVFAYSLDDYKFRS